MQGGCAEPSVCSVLLTKLVEAEKVDAVGLVVEGDDAVGEEKRGVRVLGFMERGVAALGLELIAEVADEAAVELEGEVRELRRAKLGGAAVEVVEDRSLGTKVVGNHFGEWTARVPHEREARALASARAVEPKGILAVPEERDEDE